MKLQQLKLHNFLSYREADIALDNKGLCLIAGSNLDENDSNGAGKSTLPNAICYALFGRTIKGLQADSVINWDTNKDCYVALTININGLIATITRYRKYKDIGDAVHVQIEDDLHTGKITEMQGMINELTNTDYETFINTVVFSSDTARFIGSSTDQQRREVFSKLLNLSRFERAAKLTKEKFKEVFEQQSTLVDRGLDLAERHQACVSDLNFFKEKVLGFEDERSEKIKEHEDAIKAVGPKRKVKSLRRSIELYKTSLDLGKVSELEEQVAKQRWDIGELQGDITELKEREVLDECPYCNRSFKKDKIVEAKAHIKEELSKAVKDLEGAGRTLKEWEDTLRALHKLVSVLDNRTRELDDKERQNERRAWKISSIKDKIDEWKGQGNPHVDTAERKERGLLVIEEEMSVTANELRTVKGEAEVADKLVDLFDKKGIPSYIIENSFGYIEDKANEYLEVLSGGAFQLALESERTLASGEKKEEITLRVFYHGRETNYNNASDGQQQRLDTALLFAINSYCRSTSGVDFLLLDEVLDISLDETGQEKLMELLRYISKEIGSIFVISHKQNIKDQFDTSLNVLFKDGVSQIL